MSAINTSISPAMIVSCADSSFISKLISARLSSAVAISCSVWPISPSCIVIWSSTSWTA